MHSPTATPNPSVLTRKRPARWRFPMLRPARVERTSDEPCHVRIHRFRPWLLGMRQPTGRGAASFGAFEIVMAAAVERGATLRPTEQNVMAVLRRLRHRYPPAGARMIASDARAARAVLGSLKPAMVRCASGAWRLNRHIIRGSV